ncbi:tetrahydromethanopterin S-methyltransferase subunit A [Candidatus Bathyarchaeota archaeon]|nr:tetrahydromethanopterin S-methyltransferase subunit A [Candidatus Bathyarchaeota archaeon]
MNLCNIWVRWLSERAIQITGYKIRKVEPPPDYPPEEGRFLRGNDYSPAAVVAILDTYDFKIPPKLVKLVEVAVESGAALAGTLQTENIGIEKIIANVVANPNIRYIILCWRESQGHLPADALINLVKNGVAKDKRQTIIGAKAQSPYLPNISLEAIERFRRQVTIVNLISEDNPRFGMDPENVRKAVWSCIQEKPTEFMHYTLYDPGAWPEPPICQKITMKITEPWRPELSEKEAETIQCIREAARKESIPERDLEKKEKPKKDEELLEFLGIKKKNVSAKEAR